MNTKVEETMEKIYDKIDKKVSGVNEEGLKEYMTKLVEDSHIDFNTIPLEWLVSNTIRNIYPTESNNDMSVVDCFVSEDEFAEATSMEFGVINPLIYIFAQDTAVNVKAKLVTPETREQYNNTHKQDFDSDILLSATERCKQLIKERLNKTNK